MLTKYFAPAAVYGIGPFARLGSVVRNQVSGYMQLMTDPAGRAQILRDLGIKSMRLLTNNPRKFIGLEGYGLSVSESVPLEVPPKSEFTRRYMKTKKDKLGHRLKSV